MAGGGIGDLFSGIGGALSSVLGGFGGGGGGGGGGGALQTNPDLATEPQNAPNNILTNPLVGSEEAVSGQNPAIFNQQQQQQQQPIQSPDQPTFTQPPQTAPQPQQQPQQFPSFQTMDAATAQPNYLPPDQAAPGDPNTAQPITAPVAQAPAGQANIDTPRPDQQAAQTDQSGPQQGNQQGQPNQQGNQQRQQNPLTQAGNLLKNIAKPRSAPAPSPLASLLNRGPGGLLQDLMGLTNQVGPAYGPQEYGSQGATEHGYGYGAGEPPAQAAAMPPSPPQQPPAPQPPTDREAQAAQAEQAVQAEIAAQEASQKTQDRVPGGNIAWTTRPGMGASGGPPAPSAGQATQTAQRPAATPASLTTGQTGSGAAANPVAQGEIQISPYSRSGAPPMKPSQPSVDVSPLSREAQNPQTVQRMAQMVSQEVSLRPGNTRAQIIQLETLRNRALYGIQGNGRYPDGTRAPTSLAQAGQTISGPYSRAGYAGYYPNYSNQRVSPAQLDKFKREVYDVVFPPDGSPGSNLSDVGWGPMTGNASNNPRMGERGMVAKHQYMRGTQGYSMRKSGGDDYFREHVRPGDNLPGGGPSGTMTALEPQRAGGLSDLEGVINTTAGLAPRGLPTQDWRRSSNIENAQRNPFMTPLAYPPAGVPVGQNVMPESVYNQAATDQQALLRGSQSPMSQQLGFGDIDPLLDQIAQQWAMQFMGGQVPMPRPRPR